MLKRILGIDRLHWGFLFSGLAIAILVFALWYPFVIDVWGWERGKYIVIDSWVAQAIGSLVITFIIGILYQLRFWLLLRWLAANKKEYRKDKAAAVGIIILVVNFIILPKIIGLINLILGWLVNAGISIILLVIPAASFLFVMQLWRFLASRHS